MRMGDLTGFQSSEDYKARTMDSTSAIAVSEDMTERPSYLELLDKGLLERRVEELESLLERCTVCPRDCLNNRLNNEIAACYSGRLPIVSSYTPTSAKNRRSSAKGAGNIFFGNCNLRCVYCQNYQISQTHKEQIKNEVTHERLAEMMLELQARGCHNVNFVSPTHFAPQMARSILIAARQGLRVPVVYNTNAYDAVAVLRLLDRHRRRLLAGSEIRRRRVGLSVFEGERLQGVFALALREMYRQTGDELVFDENGLLKRGLVVRLLVLPNDIGSIAESIEWIRDELSPRVAFR